MHHAGELVFSHLPVANVHPRFGDQLVEVSLHRVDCVHAVVDKENLPAAFKLAQNGLPHQSRRIWSDVGHNRQAFFGRRVQVRDVAHTRQRHVQRARNRRRGQGQHIHFGTEFFEVFLVRHAEALFFVNDDQTQVFEFHIRRNQAVRADDDVNFAKCKFEENLGLLAGRAEARKHFHFDGESRQPL